MKLLLYHLSLALLLVPCLLETGCERFPKDADHTLSNVKNDTLKVGVSHNPPFTFANNTDSITGDDVELVQKFAKELNATIAWVPLGEGELFKKLENHEIDMVIGGILKKSPWKKKGGFTVYYKKTQKEEYVMAVPQGENAFLMKLDKFLIDHRNKPQ